VELAGARCPEAFARVGRGPDVKVANLRAFGGRDADYAAGGHFPGFARARWEGERCGGRFTGGGSDAGVEGFVGVEDGARGGLVGWLRFGAGGRLGWGGHVG
jgi:hypothetical protein